MIATRSHRHPDVAEAARLHRGRHRIERGQTIIEGPSLLAEALSSGVVVRQVFALADDEVSSRVVTGAGLTLALVDQRGLDRLAGTKSPRGPVAVIDVPVAKRRHDHNLLVSYGVSDPGNVGALVRIAAAFDWDFAYTTGTADPWAPKTLRGGTGAHFRTSVTSLGDIRDLVGYSTVATVVSGGRDVGDLKGDRYAVLVGDEAAGLSAAVADVCDAKVTVAMPGGTESLNVAVAAGIVVHALTRHTGRPGGEV